MNVMDDTTDLLETALVKAWTDGQSGEPTPDRAAAAALVWELVRLASTWGSRGKS